MGFAVEKKCKVHFPRKWFWAGWPSRAPSCCIWGGGVMLMPHPLGFTWGGARWRVQHLWRQWYGASELHRSWEFGIVWTVFFWGKHGRGYIEFNYAMYVYIFFNSYTYMPFFVHLYIIIYMIWLLRKEILCQLEWCIFLHVQGFIHPRMMHAFVWTNSNMPIVIQRAWWQGEKKSIDFTILGGLGQAQKFVHLTSHKDMKSESFKPFKRGSGEW